ncbi:hypothetical protein DLAC_10674 [Tieghemostelium lacteum]|uniref:Uncharacterized protein n=1 Tax=Tieghemostelium lacteum TaxID=361077 RepID=A0A151Z4J9_TIELA|nr:hypothetical protein DLAC_10674 [Tieghemostelium lacteum]|eukprot:KYQ88868.1 hypothetical protein DLAC_10674 [Tieghemostelium lacteum]
METIPAYSELIKSSSKDQSTNISLSQRLVLKFKVQIFLSCQIATEIPALETYIEKKVFELLSQYIKEK